MTRTEAFAAALERIYGSDQSLEAPCLEDALEDLGWVLRRAETPVGHIPNVPRLTG